MTLPTKTILYELLNMSDHVPAILCLTILNNQCKKYGAEEDGYVNYVKGANIAGFVKVADAMLAQGVV